MTFTAVLVCAGQGTDGLQGHVFRSNEIGLTYSFPMTLSGKVEQEMAGGDPTGRERIILALWASRERTGIPRMAFLYDTKVSPEGMTREIVATQYLAAMKQEAAKVEGVRISPARKISPAGYPIWRLDYSHPGGSGPPYNSAIVIPLKDRRLLTIQINAPSQAELDQEVNSLRELRFDNKF